MKTKSLKVERENGILHNHALEEFQFVVNEEDSLEYASISCPLVVALIQKHVRKNGKTKFQIKKVRDEVKHNLEQD